MRIINLFGARVAVFVKESLQLARKRQNGTEPTGVGSLAMQVLKSSRDLEGTAFCKRAQGIVTRCSSVQSHLRVELLFFNFRVFLLKINLTVTPVARSNLLAEKISRFPERSSEFEF